MKIEYIADGSADCPLIRLSGHDPVATSRLRDACRALAAGNTDSVAIHTIEGFAPVGNVTLTAVATRRNRGVTQIGSPDMFQWELTPVWWSNVEGLLDPFCVSDPTPTGYQWLDDSGDASVLISPTGSW